MGIFSGAVAAGSAWFHRWRMNTLDKRLDARAQRLDEHLDKRFEELKDTQDTERAERDFLRIMELSKKGDARDVLEELELDQLIERHEEFFFIQSAKGKAIRIRKDDSHDALHNRAQTMLYLLRGRGRGYKKTLEKHGVEP